MGKTYVQTAVFYAVITALLIWFCLSLSGYVDDDAYIHIRIAENLLNRGAPYFNPQDPVMTSSSSGWTITLFLIFLTLGVNLKAVSVFNALITALDVFVYARLTSALTGKRGMANDLLAASVAVPLLATPAAGLMETPIAMLLLGLGALLYANRKPASFLLFTAGAFFRPELVVVLAAFAAYNVYRRSVPLPRMAVYVLAGSVPFVVYNMAFFGTNIPHTVAAKEAVYSLTPAMTLFFAVLPLPPGGQTGRILELCLMLLLPAAAVAGLLRDADRPAGPAIPLAVSGMAVLSAYLLKNVLVFQWYVPIYALPIFMTLLVYTRTRKALLFGALAAVALTPFLVDFGSAVYASGIDGSASRYFISGARTRKYVDVGARLYRRYPDCTLMSSEIGGLGYGFKGYVYDACGLATEGALRYHPMNVPDERPHGALGCIPPGYVAEVRPDIIVSYDAFDRALANSAVLDDYVALQEPLFMPEDDALAGGRGFWGSSRLDVFIRRDKYLGAF